MLKLDYVPQPWIEYNRQRIKNGQQFHNEGMKILWIQAERAKDNQNQTDKLERNELGQFQAKPVSQTFGEVAQNAHERRTDTQVASTIGLGSGEQWRKLDYVAQNKPELLPEIKLRAERKAGELLARMEMNKGAATPSHDVIASPPTLKDIGISLSDSSRWQLEAAGVRPRWPNKFKIHGEKGLTILL